MAWVLCKCTSLLGYQQRLTLMMKCPLASPPPFVLSFVCGSSTGRVLKERGIPSRRGEGERLVVEAFDCREFEGLQYLRKGVRGRKFRTQEPLSRKQSRQANRERRSSGPLQVEMVEHNLEVRVVRGSPRKKNSKNSSGHPPPCILPYDCRAAPPLTVPALHYYYCICPVTGLHTDNMNGEGGQPRHITPPPPLSPLQCKAIARRNYVC